jgi:deoxyribose-phosphate aldolase
MAIIGSCKQAGMPKIILREAFMTKNEIAKMIDHTQLAATAGRKDIAKLCAEAKQYGFASVCVNPVYVPMAAELLKGSGVHVCTVVSFPLGAESTVDKVTQAARAIGTGADEIDMVIDVGAAKEGRFEEVEEDIASVVDSCRHIGRGLHREIIVKVILETCYLDNEQIAECSLCAKHAGADFVKTSTGFGTPKDNDGNVLPNGATVHAVALMRQTVGSGMGVKASGGIRDAQTASEMIKAGATRIGTSSGVKIIENWKE